MWSALIFVSLASWATAQGSRQARQSEPYGWDIRLAVPGEPGADYPTLGSIPRTSFSCAGKEPGYYADLETSCQVFRVCTSGSTYGFQSFLCPNGTLFNQAVFVCDWWMNVNCERSQELFNSNNDKFGNLRLGPQLMKDIKKMLTHSMRNPYDKTVMKSNFIVMQDYKPPQGQMFGALLAGPERPNSLYAPAKLVQGYQNSFSNNAIAASTASSQYVPPPFNTLPTQSDAEIFQRQRQNAQQFGRIQQAPQSGHISNGHIRQHAQNQVIFSNNNINSVTRPQKAYNLVQSQKQTNYATTQSFLRNAVNSQRSHVNHQNSQYTTLPQSAKQRGYEAQYSKQQYNYPSPAEQSYSTKDNTGHINTEARQNLVSKNTPATIVTKTVTYNKIIQDPKPGQPKSRITFKTWIVKPSRAAKLISEPTAYTYNKPTTPPPPPPAKIISEPTPYVYNPPSTARIIAEPTGYVYNKPTVAAKQIITTVKVPSRLYLNPTVLTSPPPTLSRFYLNPTTSPPTVAAKLYLPPTTYKPAAKLYIPPSQSNIILSRQYLAPSAIQQPAYYQSEQLRASPTTPTPVYAAPPDNPSFSLTKHSRTHTNHNNLSFADILTKEKLDITVNDIVKDTSKVLQTASPPQFEQFRQEKDYSEERYIPPDDNEESDENLTPQSPTVSNLQQSARLIVNPATDLEPPVETYDNNVIQNSNPIANLPFYKEPSATNTIERTVSLKISIPEKVASYLFKSHNESDFDRLEILNTADSNYLVLSNNLVAKSPGASFIPIGRLISDKSTNISDSQALVFSFLTDSLNAAKEYSNLAQQNTQTQYQPVNNEDISQLTNQVSQLTAAQYSNYNQNQNHANIVSTQTATTTNTDQYRPAKYTNFQQNPPQQQSAQINSARPQSNQSVFPARIQNDEINANIHDNSQIYSGQLYQLPVPDVTNQVYNAEPARLVQARTQHTEAEHLHDGGQNKVNKQSAEVEVVRSESVPVRPAKLQQAPSEEAFSSQEQSTQALNFINNGDGISAQVRDKITGTIAHPSQENKFVTYKKDQSYFVYTKLDSSSGNYQNVGQSQSAKLIQNPNVQNVVTFQLVPSVSYQLEDEKEQQKILNAFQIDQYGSPKASQQNHQDHELTSNVNYYVDHPSAKQVQLNEANTIYTGPSSYSAAQESVGNLGPDRNNQNNNLSSRLEQFDEQNNNNIGYGKVTPARPFSFSK